MPRPRIPDRRHRILAAARELALTRSWPRTTVADIAELAGVGKGAVYLEFPSRDAILDAVLTAAMRDLTAAVHRRCRAHEGLLDLPAVYRIGIEELLAEPLLRAVQLGDEDVLGAHVHTVDPARYRTRMDWLGQYVAALQDAGVLRKDVDREVLGQVLGTFTIGPQRCSPPCIHTWGELNASGRKSNHDDRVLTGPHEVDWTQPPFIERGHLPCELHPNRAAV